MKEERQKVILEIIEAEPIDNQEQLIARLKEHGIIGTQATVSRDLKELHIIKEPTGNGRYRYAVSKNSKNLFFAERLQAILRESILGVDYAQNIVVLKTLPGLAGAAGAAFDGMETPQMVGSIAGDDTVMIVMRDTESAREFCAEIARMHG